MAEPGQLPRHAGLKRQVWSDPTKITDEIDQRVVPLLEMFNLQNR
jgi:hypothetical protein